LTLAAAAVSAGAAASRSTALSVEFKPEVLLTQSSGTVNLKIRLAGNGSARLWIADNCGVLSSAPEGAGSYVVGESGAYQISTASLPGSGSMVCLASTDGLTAETSSGQPPAASAGII
jgi:hypothetical protein